MQNDPWSQISKRTIALALSPVGILLLSAARLIIVSDYNTTTAVTIASSGGYINTLLGSIIPLVPVFAPYLALILLLFKRFFLSILTFIFAAFITPTRISLPEILLLAKADWNQLFPGTFPYTGSKLIVIIILLGIFVSLWFYHRSFVEAASIVVVMIITFALLVFTTFNEQLSIPVRLRTASTGERHMYKLFNWGFSGWADVVVTIVIVIAIAGIIWAYDRSVRGALTTIVAIVASIALYPYVSNIYPVPRQSNYYVTVLHQPWLPAQNITLSSGRTYNGYILSTSNGWFTVLLTNRTIVYISADRVIRRSVCQPRTSPAPPQYRPLVPLLYTKPSPTPACPPSVMLTSIRSRGESLWKISSVIRHFPRTIISATNAHEHGDLSGALRRYENLRDWNAPTPVGQRFWYYPRSKPSPSQSG